MLLALVIFFTRKPENMPPGTFGLPILGNLPSPYRGLTGQLREMMQVYGSVFTTKWGFWKIIVLTDYELARKAFNHPDIQGRAHFYSFRLLYSFKNNGVINSDGPLWVENRRFLMRLLRDLGMGKTVLESSIQEEAGMLVDHLENTCLDKPSEMDLSINTAVLNVIWQMLASKRYDCSDDEIRLYTRMESENLSIIQGPIFLLDVLPGLEKFVPQFVLNKFMKVHVLLKNRDSMLAMFEKVIEEHKSKLDLDNPGDIIDHYLLSKNCSRESPPLSEDDRDNLCNIMGDIFIAGSDTTSATLRFVILYMVMYPEVQAQVHRCLDEVVPNTRLPSLADRTQLPYVDAMLLDVMRLSSLAPIAIPHRATADVHFEGYTIPKDSLVIACLELCHHDPSIWEKPDVLYPEHFLDEQGNLSTKKHSFMPFSVGRRQCLGESLARMELFLFATAILQRFSIQAPDGMTLTAETNPAERLLNVPKPFQVVLKKRL
ncbi:Cytochrome P450 [Trinorchestia longiramus]|nr:Cytochrome P450 [Trinorchestia longiramus]